MTLHAALVLVALRHDRGHHALSTFRRHLRRTTSVGRSEPAASGAALGANAAGAQAASSCTLVTPKPATLRP
ncbi:MAG: hypothetical protein R2856_33955 [Caldilineaceae bacterium]